MKSRRVTWPANTRAINDVSCSFLDIPGTPCVSNDWKIAKTRYLRVCVQQTFP
jgi:hypothetical protein